MYVKCKDCHTKNNLEEAGKLACINCGKVQIATISEIYTNVFPLVFYSVAKIVSPLVVFMIFYKYWLNNFALFLLLSASIIALVSFLETLHTGVVRSLLGTYYKSQNFVFVVIYLFVMLALSIFLSMFVFL